jgi:hypothetical protein
VIVTEVPDGVLQFGKIISYHEFRQFKGLDAGPSVDAGFVVGIRRGFRTSDPDLGWSRNKLNVRLFWSREYMNRGVADSRQRVVLQLCG